MRDPILRLCVLILPLVAWAGNAAYAAGEPAGPLKHWSPAVVGSALVLFVLLHGGARYGRRLLARFVLTVFIVAWLFETASILTGFPFGNYHYAEVMAPFLGHVPVFVLPAYLVMGYASWSLATLLLGRAGRSAADAPTRAEPLLAALLMVTWDLSMDPLRATVEGRWVWLDGGLHYGVPLENYLGWFLVTWVMFQAFAMQVRRDGGRRGRVAPASRLYWLSVPLAYSAFAVEYLLNPFVSAAGTRLVSVGGELASLQRIYGEIALVTAFTMVPLACLGGMAALRGRARDRPAPGGVPSAWDGGAEIAGARH